MLTSAEQNARVIDVGLCEDSRSLGHAQVESEKGEKVEVERLRLNAIAVSWIRR